ncbi:MAG: ammonia-forming cytochrome c nitrite reductase subunit c552 [Betaproteobacteria bacterium]|nr:ammonia-forming cytochrome c nitrite reductase subunit c552 [Betaproteobacteria bacterium]
MSNLAETIKRSPSIGWLILLVVMAVVFMLGLLGAGITATRAQNASVLNIKKPIESTKATFIDDPAEPWKDHDKKKVKIAKATPAINGRNNDWGVNFPREYDTWKKTRETDFRSKHLGNAPEDVLESRPNMVVLWAGYAFSRDYSAPRGHWYTLYDMRRSLRTGAPGVGENKDLQPGTCWTCKSPDVPRMMQEIGNLKYYSAKWSELGSEIVNPLGCAECHDPSTMNLSLSRPALVEAFKRMPEKPAAGTPIPNVTAFLERIGNDVVRNASPNDMRSLVCAQCHVEYYFGEGDNKYLTFPWDKGITVEDMEKYYDQTIFTVPGKDGPVPNQPYFDWKHKLSGAPMLKAQHPDFEVFLLGTHGKRGVSCADCHMPYRAEGGVKYTDHQIMSPLKNVAATCQNCHRDSEDNLKAYVYDNQDRILEIRDRVEIELAKAHIMTKAAMDAGATSDEIKPVHQLLREAGWRWDFGVAGHGASFHAPVESARILSHALDKSLLAQIEVQKLLTKYNATVTLPDLANWKKAEAQQYIGLDMETLKAEKNEFLKTVVPAWIEQAKQAGKLTEPDLLNQPHELHK